MLRNLVSWLALRDYDEAMHRAQIDVIRRYARRNISFQNGDLLDDQALEKLRAAGDRALADLSTQARTATGDARSERVRLSA